MTNLQDAQDQLASNRKTSEQKASDQKKFIVSLAALAVSFVAVVLSQLDPIRTYFAKPNIQMTVSNQAQFGHNWGSLELQEFVQFENTGSATGRVTRLEAYVQSREDATLRYKLPAQAYLPVMAIPQMGQTKIGVPFGNLVMKPGDAWEAFVRLTPDRSKNDEETISEFIALLS